MNAGLIKLIEDYQAAVRDVVALLERSGISRPTSPRAWVEYNIPQRGQLVNGVDYFKHGYGCAVQLPSGKVDFDFGNEGQINGFDLWRLARFADGKMEKYGFASEPALKVTVTVSRIGELMQIHVKEEGDSITLIFSSPYEKSESRAIFRPYVEGLQ